ncbi:MAG TPA: TSUP family transporter, partial [Planctomycetota bacterium]|nr:TSUP family transporter [Planctomycetota bacterium]
MKGLPALLLGGVTGLLSGLLGIGGGLVVGPSLALLGMPMGRALGTALWVVFPVATVIQLIKGALFSLQTTDRSIGVNS